MAFSNNTLAASSNNPTGLRLLVTLILVGSLCIGLGLLYKKALPKPLPGIPYNIEASTSVFGDIPSIFEWKKKHGEQRRWFQAQAVKHNSPIVQIFTRPFSRAQVVLVDHREIHDVFHRRHREFDRSYRDSEAFGGIMPDELTSLKSVSQEYRFHRDLMKDLMLPVFLEKVNAPEIYAKTMLLVQHWGLKAKIANGRPFSAKEDIHKAALDIILSVSFGLGEQESSIKKQHDALESRQIEEKLSARNEPFHFDQFPMSKEATAITKISASVEIGLNSPLPVQHHWLLRQFSSLGTAMRIKNRMTRREIFSSLARMPKSDEEAKASARTALDNLLYRERLLAKRAGRKPNYYATYIFDELLAYVVAGHDTASTTIAWGLMYLTDNQQSQTRLREHLAAVFSDAVKGKRQPSVQEIVQSHAPYLDATIEEILRASVVFPLVTRQATVDTTLLGHHIPKDTLVMCITNGPSFFRPAIPVDECRRSKTSQAAPDSIGSWDPEDMHLFLPERWLDENQDGTTVFNSRKGPMNSFGGGPRGCFGKRLAYMELRVIVVLLFYNFKFLSIQPNLRSYARKEQMMIEPAECLVCLEEFPVWI